MTEYQPSLKGVVQALSDLIIAVQSGRGGGTLVWGTITGTLSDQVDLATALSGKQSTNVELTGLTGLTGLGLIERQGAGTYATTPVTSYIKTLLDDTDAATARSTLGLTIGTNVQAYSTELAGLAGLSLTGFLERTGAGTYTTNTVTAFAKTLLDDSDAATARTTLGLVIGTNVQAYNADLNAIAGLSLTGFLERTGSGTYALNTVTAFAKTLLDDTNASAARTTLGLVIGTDVQAYNARLNDITSNFSGASNGTVLAKNSGGTAISYQKRTDHYIKICDKKTSGTQGGDSVGSTWATRTLNTVEIDTASIVSLTSNQFTLPAGTYRIHASAPALQTGGHQIRLYNVTTSSVARYGTPEFSSNNASSLFNQTRSTLSDRLTIASSTTFRIEHYTDFTYTPNGFGTAISQGDEYYTIVEIWVE